MDLSSSGFVILSVYAVDTASKRWNYFLKDTLSFDLLLDSKSPWDELETSVLYLLKYMHLNNILLLF